VYLIEKGQIWAYKVRSSRLGREEVWYSLQHMIMKNNSTFDNHDKDTTRFSDDPDTTYWFAKCGNLQDLKPGFGFFLHKISGFGISSPIHYARAKEGNPKLILVIFNTTMIQCGLVTQFLEHPYEPFRKILYRTWMTTLWEHVQDNQILIHNSFRSTHGYDMDSYIMAHAIRNKIPILQLFNICCIFPQIETLSDIMTADGKSIRRAIWNGRRQVLIHPLYSWPTQPRPGSNGWNIWWQGLRSLTGANSDGKFSQKFPPLHHHCNIVVMELVLLTS
jgi:hypothetical protein